MGCCGSTESSPGISERSQQSLVDADLYAEPSWRRAAPLRKGELSSIGSVSDPESTLTVGIVVKSDATDFAENIMVTRSGMVRRVMLPHKHWVEVKLVSEGQRNMVQIYLIQDSDLTSPVQGKVWTFTLPNSDLHSGIGPYAFAGLIHWMVTRNSALSPDKMTIYLDDCVSQYTKEDGRVDWASMANTYRTYFFPVSTL
jgi:hypothetical protein